ncbi:DNA/RNA nuclease SfsA [Fusibacter sp. JL216-2]|uniref:DNA/RNA nuclease SfsA n=1 Tax=Fusibacter sp. JL216-2 TaxID=3071453 RepID=UPI003D34EF03
MKLKDPILIGEFVERPNRFLAKVKVDEVEVMAHVPNTSRLSELTIPGTRVGLSFHDDEKRKTKYSLRMMEKMGEWFSIDSQLPNDLVEEALNNNVIKGVEDAQKIEREKTFGNSRFDFRLLDNEGKTVYIEVKGVTLEISGEGHFPGAPTTRGVKHLKELAKVVRQGHRAAVVFVLQFNGAKAMKPNWNLDPMFSQTLLEVSKEGVDVLAYACDVTLEEITVVRQVPVILDDYR